MTGHSLWAFVLGLVLGAMIGSGEADAATRVAADTPGCVSKVEFNSMNESRTKREVEQRWEVRGKGERAYMPLFDTHATFYPKCDAKPGAVFPEGQYGVFYELRDGRYWAVGLVWV